MARLQTKAIQIHLMLLFNPGDILEYREGGDIQIHLMLLFNNVTGIAVFVNTLFKYISCYYLTPKSMLSRLRQAHSNTSHVII